MDRSDIDRALIAQPFDWRRWMNGAREMIVFNGDDG